MRSKLDSPFVGLFLGILIPVIGMLIFYKTNFNTLDIKEFFEHVERLNKTPQLISLSVVANLGLFFLFIWKKFYYSAKGVIIATFLYTMFVLIIKYFV